MMQDNSETYMSEDWNVAEQDCSLIESIISTILSKIIDDLPVFQWQIQGFDDYKKNGTVKIAEFLGEYLLNKTGQKIDDSNKGIQIGNKVTGQDGVTESTVSLAEIDFPHIPSSRNDSNKKKELDSNETKRDLNECCKKEQLLFALQLSPVSRNSRQFFVGERHEEGKKRESVHFNSPVAVVYEFSESSQAVSDTSTQILSNSDSEDFPLSQIKCSADSEVKNEGHSDPEFNRLLNLDEAKCIKDCIMTAGGDYFNVRLTETIRSDNICQGQAFKRVDETNRDLISYGFKITMIPDSPIYNEKLSETHPLYAEEKTDLRSEDFLQSQTKYRGPGIQIEEIADSGPELNALLDLDAEKFEGCQKDILTPEGGCSNDTIAGTSESADVILDRSVEKIDETSMKNTKQIERNESDENHSVIVTCKNNCNDLLTDNSELYLEEHSLVLLGKSSKHNKIKNENKTKSLSENRKHSPVTMSESVDSEDIRADMMEPKEQSTETYQEVFKNNAVENITLDEEACIRACFQAACVENCRDQKALHEKQTAVSNTMENHKLDDNMQRSGGTRKSDHVEEKFTKIPLIHEDINCSHDVFLNTNRTEGSKISESCFSKLNSKCCIDLEMTSSNKNRSGIDKNLQEAVENYPISDTYFLESHSETIRNEDITNTLLKHEALQEAIESNKQRLSNFEQNCNDVKGGSDGIIETQRDNLFQVGKRELSCPGQHWSQLSKKSKPDSEEMTYTSTRKRKFFGLELNEIENVKMIKLNRDISTECLAENAAVPKMLKQLARDTLIGLDEAIIWSSSKVLKECMEVKENTEEVSCKNIVAQCCGNGHTNSCKKDIYGCAEKNADQNESETKSESTNKNLEVQAQITAVILSSSQYAEELQLSKSAGNTDQNISQTSKTAQEYTSEIAGSSGAPLPSETYTEFGETVECFQLGQDTHESQGFITATELLSQSSQNSGSTGFTVTAGDLYVSKDICRNGTSDITDVGLISAVIDDEAEDKLSREQKGNSEQEQENECITVHSSNSKSIVEITEDGFKEERLEDELHGISLSGSMKKSIEFNDCQHTVTDQDEQIDTDQLDMYVDRAVDQVVPNEHADIADRTVETESGNELYKNDDAEKLKLYTCDSDLCDEQGSPLCITMNKPGKSYEKCFNWKYRPSCDLDIESVPELPDEDHVVRITPLKTCGKPLRLGLSKRQPMKNSLHKLGIRK